LGAAFGLFVLGAVFALCVTADPFWGNLAKAFGLLGLGLAGWAAAAWIKKRAGRPELIQAVNGIYPVVNVNGVLVDLNRLPGYGASVMRGRLILPPITPEQLMVTAAALEVQRTAAAPAHQAGITTPPVIEQPQQVAQSAALPSRLSLSSILPPVVSLDNITLGATLSEQGELEPVTASLHELMHTLAIGASGWGKSTWLRGFLYQLAITPDELRVVAIDCSGSEFNPLKNWKRLVYPVARDNEAAIQALTGVQAEIARRKALYEVYPLATKLDEYNRLAGEDLPPWVVVCDESTALLNLPKIGDVLRETVQTARQYGIYVLLAGQSANYTVLPTQARDNFSSRLCFRTSRVSSKVVLDDRGAEKLTQPGRGLLLLPGHELTEIQAGFISREEFFAALVSGGPSGPLPTPPDTEPEAVDWVRFEALDDDADKVLYLYQCGLSKSKIERKVYGHNGGYAYRQIKQILDDSGQ
jgi:hypothetical protein